VNIEFSPEESKRHSLRIYRNISENIEKDLIDDIIKEKADLIIVRIPAEKNLRTIDKLNEMGLPYHYADTLLQYVVNLNGYSPKSIENSGLEFIECRKAHVDVLKSLIYEVFKSYNYNHYVSNIYIKQNNVTDGYVDWISSFVDSDNKSVWLVKDGSNYVAFASCSFEKEKSIGVLYGVSPHASGKHIYADLIRYTQLISQSKNIDWMQVGTQAQNYAVQRTWSKEGFTLRESLITYHVNSFLSSCTFEEKLLMDNMTIDTPVNLVRKYLNVDHDVKIKSNIRIVDLATQTNEKVKSVTVKINALNSIGRALVSVLLYDRFNKPNRLIYHDVFF
jgi:hypothetical protein